MPPSIVSLYQQERRGLRAGQVQMAIDACVVLLALLVVPPGRVAWSVLAAVLMSLFLWVKHKPGRYTVTCSTRQRHQSFKFDIQVNL